ncbi:MAG: hypothetical protein HOV68_07345, partial [Streptomycetaceae bacterium]|nr:hypothetical protein [Streptomycetaceae bacterium]
MADFSASGWKGQINDPAFREKLVQAANAALSALPSTASREYIQNKAEQYVAEMIGIYRTMDADSLTAAYARTALDGLTGLIPRSDSARRLSLAEVQGVLQDVMRASARLKDGTPSLESSYYKSVLALFNAGSDPTKQELLGAVAEGAAFMGAWFAQGSQTADGHAENLETLTAELTDYASVYRPDPSGHGEHTRQRLHDLGLATTQMIAGLHPGRLAHREFAQAAVDALDQIRIVLSTSRRTHPQLYTNEAVKLFRNAAHWAETSALPYDSVLTTVTAFGEPSANAAL